ncbi:hypothetical protein V7S43_011410 [Phytophthora oleae]|uniref:Uncharacterized protein n=1 Tax=Phytophthora oleae TaxID=2107226 RepID=A0ABD3FAQ0_9STRA
MSLQRTVRGRSLSEGVQSARGGMAPSYLPLRLTAAACCCVLQRNALLAANNEEAPCSRAADVSESSQALQFGVIHTSKYWIWWQVDASGASTDWRASTSVDSRFPYHCEDHLEALMSMVVSYVVVLD